MKTKTDELLPIANRRNGLLILSALRHHRKHVYEGTVPAHVKAKRRARNKQARLSRRANRG
jgi:hypothetical protein